jgi:CDP-diacylglycerol--glycerol-3-phosphate 3-phosphatidyltransferase
VADDARGGASPRPADAPRDRETPARDGSTGGDDASVPPIRYVPSRVSGAVMRWLDWAADRLVERNVKPNTVTTLSLVLSFLAGAMLAATAFALAAVVMTAASLGDALDGRVARRARMVSPRGALVDAASDRYQEFFLLGGIALAFRDSAWMLSIALLGILGSFMVSYGSVKAAVLETPVPAGAMRRQERALVLGAGTVLTAVLAPITSRAGLAT